MDIRFMSEDFHSEHFGETTRGQAAVALHGTPGSAYAVPFSLQMHIRYLLELIIAFPDPAQPGCNQEKSRSMVIH